MDAQRPTCDGAGLSQNGRRPWTGNVKGNFMMIIIQLSWVQAHVFPKRSMYFWIFEAFEPGWNQLGKVYGLILPCWKPGVNRDNNIHQERNWHRQHHQHHRHHRHHQHHQHNDPNATECCQKLCSWLVFLPSRYRVKCVLTPTSQVDIFGRPRMDIGIRRDAMREGNDMLGKIYP